MRIKTRRTARTIQVTLKFESDYSYTQLFIALRSLDNKGQLCPYLKDMLRDLHDADVDMNEATDI